MTFSALNEPSLVALPQPDRGGQVGGRGDHADEAVGLARVVRGPQLEHHLVLGAEVDLLDVLALLEVPDVELVAVLVAQQQLGLDAALDHVRRAPLGGDDRALVEVPPEVVGQLLRPAVLLPGALDREVLVVEQEDAAGPVAVGVAERGDVDPVGAAVDRVRARVAGLARDLVGLDDLGERRIVRVVLDVDRRGSATSAGRGRAGSGARCADAPPTGRARTSRRSSRSGAARRRRSACRGGRRAGRRWVSRPRGRGRSARQGALSPFVPVLSATTYACVSRGRAGCVRRRGVEGGVWGEPGHARNLANLVGLVNFAGREITEMVAPPPRPGIRVGQGRAAVRPAAGPPAAAAAPRRPRRRAA